MNVAVLAMVLLCLRNELVLSSMRLHKHTRCSLLQQGAEVHWRLCVLETTLRTYCQHMHMRSLPLNARSPPIRVSMTCVCIHALVLQMVGYSVVSVLIIGVLAVLFFVLCLSNIP